MSRRSRSDLARISLLIGLWASTAQAQVGNVPVLLGVYPPGATVGQETEWTISGRNLAKVGSLRVSGGGIEILELKVKDETSATARVRVASDATPGSREIRLDGTTGVSNLAIVRVDRLTQVFEVEPNDEADKAQVVEVGSALVGVLKPLDLDHYRIKGDAWAAGDARPRSPTGGDVDRARGDDLFEFGRRDRPGA